MSEENSQNPQNPQDSQNPQDPNSFQYRTTQDVCKFVADHVDNQEKFKSLGFKASYSNGVITVVPVEGVREDEIKAQEAFCLFDSIIREYCKPITKVFSIPSKFVGFIIGKHGSNLEKIKRSCMLNKIFFEKCEEKNYSKCIIEGERSCVYLAISNILTSISKLTEKEEN